MPDNQTTAVTDQAALSILLCPIDEPKSVVDDVALALNTLRGGIARCWGPDYAVGFEAVFNNQVEKERALTAVVPSGEEVRGLIMLWKLSI
jgi:hypothetical protein